MLSLLTALALAGEASHCVATWEVSATACAIDGRITASATGGNARAAERLARQRLGRVAELTGEDLSDLGDLYHPAEFQGCPDAAMRDASISCTGQIAAQEGEVCFVVFDDPECWDGTVLTVEDTWKRAVVTGRQEMCDAVDARQLRLNYSDLETRREVCQERCAVGTVVTCPPNR